MIPDKLQTGFDMSGGGDELSAEQYTFLTNVIALFMVLVKRAMKSSATYVHHQGRNVVLVDDINNALKREAMILFELDDLESQVATMIETLEQTLDGEDEDIPLRDEGIAAVSDSIIDTMLQDTVEDIGEGPSPGKEADECRCNDCLAIVQANETWETWDVSDDPVKTFLKSHIGLFMTTHANEYK